MKAKEKKVLILAYYFPPLGMGGVQRVAKFAKYLPRFGWKPYVVTVKEAEYLAKDYSLLEELPPEAEVIRTGSFDPLRIWFILRSVFRKGKRKDEPVGSRPIQKSKLSRWFFFPDTRVGWMPFALMRALRLCRSERIDLIFSSSPPPSVHLTAGLLGLLTGIPWVADFRDPWVGYRLETFPTPFHLFLKEKAQRWIISRADLVIAANRAIRSHFEMRYPQSKRIRLVSQGYDEEDFKTHESSASEAFTIGYLGTFSPDCDPEPFLSAMGEWIDQRMIPREKVRFVHVGLSTGIDLDGLIEKHRLREVVERKGYLSHRQALDRMKEVSLLLLVTSDHPSVFPAKTFEYLRLKRPILCIAPPKSQIAMFLTEMQSGWVLSPDDRSEIKEALHSCYSDFERGGLRLEVDEGRIREFDRESLTGSLASLFGEVMGR